MNIETGPSRLDHRRARQRAARPHVRDLGAPHGLSRPHVFAGSRFAHRPDCRRGDRCALRRSRPRARVRLGRGCGHVRIRERARRRPRKRRPRARWCGPPARFCTPRSTGCARRRFCATTAFPSRASNRSSKPAICAAWCRISGRPFSKPPASGTTARASIASDARAKRRPHGMRWGGRKRCSKRWSISRRSFRWSACAARMDDACSSRRPATIMSPAFWMSRSRPRRSDRRWRRTRSRSRAAFWNSSM